MAIGRGKRLLFGRTRFAFCPDLCRNISFDFVSLNVNFLHNVRAPRAVRQDDTRLSRCLDTAFGGGSSLKKSGSSPCAVRTHRNVAIVALANKLARLAWPPLHRDMRSDGDAALARPDGQGRPTTAAITRRVEEGLPPGCHPLRQARATNFGSAVALASIVAF